MEYKNAGYRIRMCPESNWVLFQDMPSPGTWQIQSFYGRDLCPGINEFRRRREALGTLADQGLDLPVDSLTRDKERGSGALQLQSFANRVEQPTHGNTVFTGNADIPRNRNSGRLCLAHEAVEPGLGNAAKCLSRALGHFRSPPDIPV
jgi:hypothetical protein